MATDRLLHAHHVAAMLNVSRRTIRLWAEIGELPAFKIGRGKLWRFRERDIADYLKNKKEGK
jgi:excisionase family DNA binding protein